VRATLIGQAQSVVDDVLKRSPSDRIVRRKAEGIGEDIARLQSK